MNDLRRPAALLDLPCPLCGRPLTHEMRLAIARWRCAAGHGYSNVRVLLAEIREAAHTGELSDHQGSTYRPASAALSGITRRPTRDSGGATPRAQSAASGSTRARSP